MRKRFETPWAIRPEAVMTVVRLVTRDMMGQSQGPASSGTGNVQILGTGWEAAKPFNMGSGPNKLAVVPIQGVLTNDGPSYYGTNYQSIADAVEKAAADSDVKRIVLAVDSPGGEVTGLPETASIIAAAAKVKPVSAIVEGAAASAAYWLTSQASDITLTPSGEVGSVGVRMMHVDMSEMLKKEGYAVTELHSGAFKTEWSPYKPLTQGAVADTQVRLDSSHADFLRAVSSGRGRRLSPAIQQARMGEGRMFQSSEALRHGLVDKLQSAREFYKGLSQTSARKAGVASVSAVPTSTQHARARLEIAKLRA